MDLIIVTALFLYIVIFSCVSIMEKHAVSKHNYMHFSASRVFYILIITLALLFVMQPSVLSSKAFYESMRDPMVVVIAVLTAFAIILYYWMLSTRDLWMMTMLWPVAMLLTIIGACVVMKENVSRRQWIGIMVTYVGLFIIFVNAT